MAKPPLVSVISPTFNHERFIGQAIESLFQQGYGNWEQIIIDDGSTDRTSEVIRSYRDDRIRFVSQKHMGRYHLADLYEKALGMCRGSIIGILEGDDFWPPDKLEKLVPAFAKPDVVMSYGITQLVNAEGRPYPKFMPSSGMLKRSPKDVLFNTPVGAAVRVMCCPEEGAYTFPCSTLIRRSALDACGGFRTVRDKHAVDFATSLTLALKGTFHFVPEVMGFWRRHLGSANTSRELESMLLADRDYSLGFLRQHATQLPEPRPDNDLVRHRWARHWSRIRLFQGRVLLLQRRWSEARAEFLRATTIRGSVRIFLAAILGMVASFLRRDIESFATLSPEGGDLRNLLALSGQKVGDESRIP